MCQSANVYCPEAVKTVKVVASCPTSKAEWEKAAIQKNCSNYAAQQNCTSANLFLYHCVMNGYGNETLEVCAPQRIISGKIKSISSTFPTCVTVSLREFQWSCQSGFIFRILCRV